MTTAALPTSLRRRRLWRRIVAGTVMATSLAFTTACGVTVAELSSTSNGSGTGTDTGTGTSNGTSGSVSLGQGSSTSSHATSQGS